MNHAQRLQGVLIGTAVGDALGLPAEGCSRRRVAKRFKGDLRHRFLFGKGMISDDTEHTLFVAQSLIDESVSPCVFARRLAWRLRWWLVALPAGVGLATLKAILRLWIGFSPERSGVFSAGNGPAMRSAIIGVFFADDPEKIGEFVRAATLITHTDPRAMTGAAAVAQLAGWITRTRMDHAPEPETVLDFLHGINANDPEWQRLIDAMADAIHNNRSVDQLAVSIGQSKGVTGYIYHSVPVAIYAWYRHFGDYAGTVTAVIMCGGDTDTTAAIAGALCGTVVGERGIPKTWVENLIEWPRNCNYMRAVANRLAAKNRRSAPAVNIRYCWPALLPRNLIFIIIVLLHGFRRLFPPY